MKQLRMPSRSFATVLQLLVGLNAVIMLDFLAHSLKRLQHLKCEGNLFPKENFPNSGAKQKKQGRARRFFLPSNRAAIKSRDFQKMSPPATMKKNPETRRLAIAAARYLAQGLTRVEIAEALDHKEPYVARLLAAAEEWGYLSRSPTILRHEISDEDWEAVENRYFQDWTFTPVLKPKVPANIHFEAYLVPGEYDMFLRGAANHIGHLVRRSQLIGVMWGRTVYMLVKYLQSLSDTLDRDLLRRIECIPLCGDPIFLMNQRALEYSASWLAATLERALTGRTRQTFPCLLGVPAYVNQALRTAFSEDLDNPGWRRFIDQIPGRKAIFGKSSPLINHVDTIITGAGIVVSGKETLEHRTGDLIEERVQQEENLGKAKLDHLIWGDIGGWLIEKPGLKPEERQLVNGLNSGWTGATLQHLKWVAEAAEPRKRVGIILVAWGTAKAMLVIEAVKRGLVNTLLIDSSLAREIEEQLKKDS